MFFIAYQICKGELLLVTQSCEVSQNIVSQCSAFEEDYVPHHSASIGSSFNTTVKGLTLEELNEKFLKRQPIEFSGEGGSFFARMGLLGKYVQKNMYLLRLAINRNTSEIYM